MIIIIGRLCAHHTAPRQAHHITRPPTSPATHTATHPPGRGAQVADLELALADLKQQVLVRNSLQQQFNILAPKAAGAAPLRAALAELEAQAAQAAELSRQLVEMRHVDRDRRDAGGSQFSEAVSNLGLMPLSDLQQAGGEGGGAAPSGRLRRRLRRGATR
jgi:hypothetical protein